MRTILLISGLILSTLITSIKSELENKIPTKAEGKPAITISIAFLKTWPYKTLFSDNPLDLAVITYC